MDNWNFGFIAPALMHNWGLTMKDLGHVTFWYFVAMTCGGLVGGVISDVIGRRKTFLIAITLFSTASIINGLTNSFPVFVASRALTGFGVFCLMVCSQAYIAEMAPAESRGKWQNTVAAVGFCAVPVIGMLCRAVIPLHEEAWRYIFYMGGFGYLALIIAWKYLDESPRWLVARGRVAEAEAIMLDITHQNIDLSAVAAKQPPRKAPLKEVLLSMCSKKYLKRTIVIFLLVILTNPATFLVTNWTATLLKAHGFSLEDCLMATTLISIGVPLGCYVSGLFSDMGGAKSPSSACWCSWPCWPPSSAMSAATGWWWSSAGCSRPALWAWASRCFRTRRSLTPPCRAIRPPASTPLPAAWPWPFPSP
jgi:putative MFS transporter